MAEKGLDIRIVNLFFPEFLAKLNDFEKNQLPFAISKALTQSAIDARNHTRDQMRKIFDQPTPWTLNGMRISAARKDKLEAKVYYDEYGDKGTPASRYLKPNTFGGERRVKPSENQLRAKGVIDSNEYLIPSEALPQDRYGNPKQSEIIKILSAFQANFDSQQHSGKYGKNNRSSNTYYITGSDTQRTMKKRTGEPIAVKRTPAIWRRNVYGAKPMFFITKHAPKYKAVFNFEDIVKAKFNECIGSNFNAAFEYALSTAKLKK